MADGGQSKGVVPATATPVWEFRVLGSLEVRRGGQTVAIGGQRQRALLALLLLNANRVVPTERLVDQLWGEHPPPTAITSLQNGIGQLRKALGAERLETRPPGYLIVVRPEELDLTSFERAVRDSREGAAAVRARALREALALWHGPPLADFTYETFAQGEIARLEDLKLAALEERIHADLELGAHAELVGELEALVAEHPVRERLRGQLMLALYRSGRQAEALEAYRTGRRALTDELGIEPTPSLQRLNAAILRQDPSLDAEGAPPAVGDGECRKRPGRSSPEGSCSLSGLASLAAETGCRSVRPRSRRISPSSSTARPERRPSWRTLRSTSR